MMRPFTCLCMLAAAGAGLYLYQEKYRAQLLDRDIAGVIKQIDQSHDRINLLKAEWALLNEPDRLATLAAQHLSLQPLAPTQFAQLADLGSRLPGPVAPDATPAPNATAPAAPSAAPMAEAAPPAAPEVAALPPPSDTPVQQAAAVSHPAPPKGATEMAALVTRPTVVPTVRMAAAAEPAAPNPHPAAAQPSPQGASVQMAAARPAVHRPAVRRPARPDEQLAAETPRPYRPLYAPVMSAFASGAAAQAIHAPTVQRTAAGFTEPASPYVGSALGMAGATLAAPVPINAGR